MFHVSGFIDGLLFIRMKGFLSTGLLSWFAANLFSTDDRLMGSCRLISKQGQVNVRSFKQEIALIRGYTRRPFLGSMV